MTHDVVERPIRAMLRDEAGAESAPYLDEVLGRVRDTRQRPSWVIRERWLPMDLALVRPARPARLAPILVTLAAVVALLVGAVLVGSQRRLPPPFGLAANGDLAVTVDDRIVLMHPDGSARREVVLPFAHAMMPVYSPRGDKLAFWTRETPDGPVDLQVADADGSHTVRVNGGVAIVTDVWLQPTWSPDGRELVFATSTGTTPHLMIASADGSSPPRPVGTGLGVIGATPHWSPDGRWIAFQAGDPIHGTVSLGLIHPDGSGYRERASALGADTYSFAEPSWSRDSQRVLYYAGPGLHHIAVYDLATDLETQLSGGYQDEFFPSWSPDDSRILWTTAGSSVKIAAPDGTRGTEIPAVGFGYVVWSPDGKKILALDDAADSLVIASSDGTGSPTRIRIGGSPTAFLSWQRIAAP